MPMEKIIDVFDNECQELVDNDIDWIHLNIGGEGTGKSTFGIHFGQTVQHEPPFNIEGITHGYPEFTHRLDTAPQGTAVHCDEGGDVFLSRESMSKPRADILKQMMKIRAKNLFVIINISDLSLLEGYLKNFRVKSLTRTKMYYRNGRYYKGYVEIYDKNQCRLIHKDANGKMRFPKPAAVDTFDAFPKDDPLWVAYRKKDDDYKLLQKKERLEKTKEHPIKKFFGNDDELLKKELIRRIEKRYSTQYAYQIITDALNKGIILKKERGKLKYFKLLK
jgi:hypothetical protein